MTRVGGIDPRALPEFAGYTVDARLREFRKVDCERMTVEFVPFSSPKGQRLLARLRRSAGVAL